MFPSAGVEGRLLRRQFWVTVTFYTCMLQPLITLHKDLSLVIFLTLTFMLRSGGPLALCSA